MCRYIPTEQLKGSRLDMEAERLKVNGVDSLGLGQVALIERVALL